MAGSFGRLYGCAKLGSGYSALVHGKQPDGGEHLRGYSSYMSRSIWDLILGMFAPFTSGTCAHSTGQRQPINGAQVTRTHLFPLRKVHHRHRRRAHAPLPRDHPADPDVQFHPDEREPSACLSRASCSNAGSTMRHGAHVAHAVKKTVAALCDCRKSETRRGWSRDGAAP